jgi:hypothetical protein
MYDGYFCYAHAPLLLRHGLAQVPRAAPPAAAGAPVDKNAGIGGVLEDRADARLIGRTPEDIAQAVAARQTQMPLAQSTHDLGGGLAGQEQLEHQRQSILHFPVGMLEHLSGGVPLQPHRQAHRQLATLGLVQQAGVEPIAQGVQFHLGDLALEAQQQPPVNRGRIVDALMIAQQTFAVAAGVQQRIPVGAVARQPRGVVSEDDADLAQRYVSDQLLKSHASPDAGGAVSQIAVNHAHVLWPPSQLDGALPKGVLQCAALVMAVDLVSTGLTDVHHGRTLQMGGADPFAGDHGLAP